MYRLASTCRVLEHKNRVLQQLLESSTSSAKSIFFSVKLNDTTNTLLARPDPGNSGADKERKKHVLLRAFCSTQTKPVANISLPLCNLPLACYPTSHLNRCLLYLSSSGWLMACRYKFDTKGVGETGTGHYQFNWWDDAFNRAADNIQVASSSDEDDDDDDGEKGVKLKVKDASVRTGLISTTAPKKAVKNSFYLGFVKPGDDNTAQGRKNKDFSKVVSDEEMKKTVGLTGHKGAIRFVLSGANIMCPGLTSPGGKLSDAEERTPVGIFCEGKKHAVCVGITKMSTADIASKNKGIGIEVIHFLNDGLWCMDPSKIL